MVGNYKKKISSIFKIFSDKDLLKDIRSIPSYNDDPKVFIYSIHLKHMEKYSDGVIHSPEGAGASFKFPEKALFKSLTEGMERFSQGSFRTNNGVKSTYNKLINAKKNALDPFEYIKKIGIRDKDFLWVKGTDFISRKFIYIPFQLVYINYQGNSEDWLISETNSNGTAGGFTHEFALSRAIYEAVERDAFFSIYLNKITPPRINISTLTSKIAKEINESCVRYNLDMLLFDITNDLDIPTFMGLLIDKTGFGPAVTVGLKSNLNPIEAIVGSMEEVFNTRTTFRSRLPNKKRFNEKISFKDINDFASRNLFWSSPQKLSQIDFLLNSPPINKNYQNQIITEMDEIQGLRSIFQKKNIDVFDIDISMELFSDIGYVVHRVVIPILQPLYIQEKAKVLKIDRLQKVAAFFGKKTTEYNQVPHFFL